MRRQFILGSLAALLPACSWLEGLFGDDKRGGPVEPVPHEQLAEVLPKMEGWQASPPNGKREDVGENHVSVVSRRYEKAGDPKPQTVELQVVDRAYVSTVYSPFAAMAHSNGAGDVHKMRIDIDGNPGMQEWKPASGGVTVALLVAHRFVLMLEGSNVSPTTVDEFIHAVDLKRLTAWAAADGHAKPG